MRISASALSASVHTCPVSLHLSMLKSNVGNVSETPMIRLFSFPPTTLSEMDEIGVKAFTNFQLEGINYGVNNTTHGSSLSCLSRQLWTQ